MDIELIDKAWACLPREFKEEMKRLYRIAESDVDQMIAMIILENVFGGHNLTSDAEGEEILTCEKSKAMQLYSHLLDLVENERMSEHYSEWCDLEREYIALFGENVFADHFGSECLPGKLNEDNFAKSEPKPAEPKNKGTRQEQCVPNNAESGTHSFSHILKDSFQNERRLNIAAQIVASMIGSDDWTTWRGGSNKEIWHNMAKSSLEIADALIAECEKGGIK